MRNLIAGALTAAAFVAAAPAAQAHAKTCETRANAYWVASVRAVQGTSCALAINAARTAQRAHWPRHVTAYSRITHRTYRLRRAAYTHNRLYFTAIYEAHGVGVQVEAIA
jgi:hypothetical protein